MQVFNKKFEVLCNIKPGETINVGWWETTIHNSYYASITRWWYSESADNLLQELKNMHSELETILTTGKPTTPISKDSQPVAPQGNVKDVKDAKDVNTPVYTENDRTILRTKIRNSIMGLNNLKETYLARKAVVNELGALIDKFTALS
jgi:hypothetical protein